MAEGTPAVLASITAEDKGRKRRPLWAYGPFFVARLAKRSRRTVRLAQATGIPFYDPVEAVAWAVARTDPALADEVLIVLGYARRYTGQKS